jgi:hypothetical protein
MLNNAHGLLPLIGFQHLLSNPFQAYMFLKFRHLSIRLLMWTFATFKSSHHTKHPPYQDKIPWTFATIRASSFHGLLPLLTLKIYHRQIYL